VTLLFITLGEREECSVSELKEDCHGRHPASKERLLKQDAFPRNDNMRDWPSGNRCGIWKPMLRHANDGCGSKNVSLHIWLEIHELCKMHGINNGQERALLGRTDAASKKQMLAPN